MTKRSPHFEVIFRTGQDALAERVLTAAEEAHRKLDTIFDEGPELTRVVLADFQDSTNGYALEFPWPHIVLFLSPPEAISQLSSLDDWLQSLILHEYSHIRHIYPARGFWKPMRSFFGAWVVPNGLMPTHFHEGLATFLETHFSEGGRGRSPAFKMAQRIAVQSGKWNLDAIPLDRFETFPSIWPMGVSPYYYGYYLYEELWQRRGAKGLRSLTNAYAENWPYFLDAPLEEVYGTTYEKLWQDIFEKTSAATKAELQTLSRSSWSTMKPLTHGGFHKWEVNFSLDGKRALYRKTDPKGGSELVFLDPKTGKELKRIAFAAGPTYSMCWGKRQDKEVLVFPRVSREKNSSINYLSGMWVNEDEAFRFSLTNQEGLSHVHHLSCHPSMDRILVYQEAATKGFIRELKWEKSRDKNGVTKVVREWPVPQGSYVSSLLFEDTPVFALRQGTKTALYRWDTSPPQWLVDIPAHLYQLRKGRNANEVLAITSLEGRDEVWAIQWATKEATKLISTLGGVISFDEFQGNYLASRYDEGGYDVVQAKPVASSRLKLAQKSFPRNVANSQDLPKPAREFSKTQSYSPLDTLLPRAWIPMLLFVPNGAQISVWVPGFDISQKHFYDLVGGYDTRGLPFASLDYHYRLNDEFTFDVGVNHLPSYLFVQKTFQKRWGAKIGVSTPLEFLPVTLRLGALLKRIEESPLGARNQSLGAEITLSTRFGFEQKPLEISPRRGTRLSVTHSHFLKALGSDDDYYSTVAAFEQNLSAPWSENHFWYLALRAGYTEGNSLFNSLYVAGGELIFSQGRGYFLNRGFQPEVILGRQMVNANLEYRFPLFRVDRGVNLLPFQMREVHAALTWDITTRDFGTRHPRDRYTTTARDLFKVFYQSVGLELRTDWQLFFYLPAEIRLGAYHGFGKLAEPLYLTLGVEASL